MARRRKENPLDKAIEAEWYRRASGVQVSVLDIPKIFREAKLELAAGKSLPDAIDLMIQRYRKN